MFFRLTIKRNQIGKTNLVNVPKFPILENTKRALNINFISLSILLVFMPINLANIYTILTEATCKDPTSKGWYLLAFSSYGFILYFPFMIEKKLDKFPIYPRNY